jgi:predicted small lipoprotein YifL
MRSLFAEGYCGKRGRLRQPEKRAAAEDEEQQQQQQQQQEHPLREMVRHRKQPARDRKKHVEGKGNGVLVVQRIKQQ